MCQLRLALKKSHSAIVHRRRITAQSLESGHEDHAAAFSVRPQGGVARRTTGRTSGRLQMSPFWNAYAVAAEREESPSLLKMLLR